MSEFLRETGISECHVLKQFDCWNDLVRAAGLHPTDVGRIDDEELFRAMRDAFVAAGRICTRTRFERLCRYSTTVYLRRGWGNWIGVLKRFREWAATSAPDFPFIAELPTALPEAVVDEGISRTGARSWSRPRRVPRGPRRVGVGMDRF